MVLEVKLKVDNQTLEITEVQVVVQVPVEEQLAPEEQEIPHL